jgi:hypothetical protein
MQLRQWFRSLGEARPAGRPAARPAKPSRRARLGLEALEAREVPSVTLYSGGDLYVQEGSGYNSVTLDGYSGWTSVTENNVTSWFQPGTVHYISVALTGDWGSQSVSVRSTPAGAITQIWEGGGSNYVYIGSRGNLDDIGGRVSVWGNIYGSGNSYNWLMIDDRNSWASVNYNLHYDNGGATLTRQNGSRSVDFHFDTQLNTFYFYGSNGNDVYYVPFTLSHDTWIVTSSLSSRNYVYVGLGSLAVIQGYLHIGGGNNNTDLVINDWQDTNSHVAYLSHDSSAGTHYLVGLTDGPITWYDSAISSFSIYTGPNTLRTGF